MRKLIAWSLVLTMAVFFATNTAMADGKDKDKNNKKSKVCFKNKCDFAPAPAAALGAEDCWDVCVLCVPYGKEPKTGRELKRKCKYVQVNSKHCERMKPGKYCIYICDASRMTTVSDGALDASTYQPGGGCFQNKKQVYIRSGKDYCWNVSHGRIGWDNDDHDTVE